MGSIDYVTTTTTEILKLRMKDAKKELSALRTNEKQDFFSFVIQKEPAYDSYQGGLKMENAWYGKTPDLRVTELIREYVTQVKTELQTKKEV